MMCSCLLQVMITNDGATILQQLDVEHPARWPVFPRCKRVLKKNGRQARKNWRS
jgi:hypothetical protein